MVPIWLRMVPIWTPSIWPYHMVSGTRGMAVVPPGVEAGETFVVECELPPEAL